MNPTIMEYLVRSKQADIRRAADARRLAMTGQRRSTRARPLKRLRNVLNSAPRVLSLLFPINPSDERHASCPDQDPTRHKSPGQRRLWTTAEYSVATAVDRASKGS
jgi:hypothetical protein